MTGKTGRDCPACGKMANVVTEKEESFYVGVVSGAPVLEYFRCPNCRLCWAEGASIDDILEMNKRVCPLCKLHATMLFSDGSHPAVCYKCYAANDFRDEEDRLAEAEKWFAGWGWGSEHP